MAQFHNDLTQGSVSRQLIKFSVPFLISNFIQALYTVIDMLIVQWVVGSTGSSAVGIGGQVTLLVSNLVIGFAVGGSVLIAQYLGAKKEEDVRQTISTLLTMCIFASIICTIVFIILAKPFLILLNTPKDVYSQAHDFFVICMLGTVFIFGYNTISAVLRGMGDSKRPLYFVAISCGVNVVLDIIFVKYFGWGAAGAAAATVTSQAISLILSVIYLYKHKFIFDFKLKSFKIYSDKLKLILNVGLPTAVQNSTITLSFLAMTSLINEFGSKASAAANLVGKYNGFAILPGLAICAAISSMSGQNIGAGLYDRAKETMLIGLKIAVGIAAVILALTLLFAPQIMGFMSNGDKEVIEIGTVYMRSYCADYVLAAFTFGFNGLINGSGHTTVTLAFNLLSSIVIRVPMAYLMVKVFKLGMFGMGFCAPIASVFIVAFGFIYVISNRWRNTATGI